MPPRSRATSRPEPRLAEVGSTHAQRLLAALGTPDLASALAPVLEGGRASLVEVLDLLASGTTLGPRDANGRAVFEDLEHVLRTMMDAHEDVFLDAAVRSPALEKSFAFVSALCATRSEDGAARLAGLLGSRDGSIRWLVLRELLDRGDARAIARLPKALRDRDGLVAFAAVRALRRHGTADHVEALLELVRSPKTAIGTREAAIDAIESITRGTGAPAPSEVPPPRLVEIALPTGAHVVVGDADLVRAGQRLATSNGEDVPAPCEGVVVDVDARSIVLRRTAPRE